MGNNANKPIQCAKSTMAKFVKELKNSGDSKITFDEALNHKFGEMLEDFAINNDTYTQMSPEDKAVCFGTLLYLQKCLADELTESTKQWNGLTFCERFADGEAIGLILCRAVASDFCYDKCKFYRWVPPLWYQCEESEVRLHNIDEKIDLHPSFSNFGLDSPDLEAGRCWIESMFERLRACASTFNDDLIPLIEMLKGRTFEMNKESRKLPGRTMTIDFDESCLKAPSVGDFFSVRLPYDPVKEIYPVTQKFMDAFPCDKSNLATSIVRWGCLDKRSLTIVKGNGSNGKSTLVEYVQHLYGPFVCKGTPHLADDVDTSLVRTCFIPEQDESGFITNEAMIKDHPCLNLVYVTNENITLPHTFGNRKVYYLEFTEPIPEEKQVSDILRRVTTRKQLASGLGWCLVNYEPARYKSLGRLSRMVQTLFADD